MGRCTKGDEIQVERMKSTDEDEEGWPLAVDRWWHERAVVWPDLDGGQMTEEVYGANYVDMGEV